MNHTISSDARIRRELGLQGTASAPRRSAPNGAKPPRFSVKFVNGIYTIFDHYYFENCEPDLGTQKNALRLLNAPAR